MKRLAAWLYARHHRATVRWITRGKPTGTFRGYARGGDGTGSGRAEP